MKWTPGQSGNPAGRRKGAVTRKTALLRKYEGRIARKIVRMALRGDHVCLKIVSDKMWANARTVSRPVKLPDVKTVKDLAKFGRAILARTAAGKISPDIARDLLAALGSQAALVEHAELSNRITELEERQAQSFALFRPASEAPTRKAGGSEYAQ